MHALFPLLFWHSIKLSLLHLNTAAHHADLSLFLRLSDSPLSQVGERLHNVFFTSFIYLFFYFISPKSFCIRPNRMLKSKFISAQYQTCALVGSTTSKQHRPTIAKHTRDKLYTNQYKPYLKNALYTKLTPLRCFYHKEVL